jgi:hypothetical protein
VFLYAHSIGLALKSFLRAQGLPIVEGKSPRCHHRLTKLYEECKALGLNIGPPDDRTDIGTIVYLLDGANEDQGLRYFNMKSASFPDLAWTRETVEKLVRVVAPHVVAGDKAAGIKQRVTVMIWGKPVAQAAQAQEKELADHFVPAAGPEEKGV